MSIVDTSIDFIMKEQPRTFTDQVTLNHDDCLPDDAVDALLAGEEAYREIAEDYVAEARFITFGELAEDLVKDFVSKNPGVEQDAKWDVMDVVEGVRDQLLLRDAQPYVDDLALSTSPVLVTTLLANEGVIDEEDDEAVADRIMELVGLDSSQRERMIELVGNVPSHMYMVVVVGRLDVSDLLDARLKGMSKAVFRDVDLVVGNLPNGGVWSDSFSGEVSVDVGDVERDPFNIEGIYGGYATFAEVSFK